MSLARRDRLPGHRDRLPRGPGRRLGAGRAADSAAPCRSTRPRCSAARSLTGVGAVLFAARVDVGLVACSSSAPAAWASSSCRGPHRRRRRDRRLPIRSTRGSRRRARAGATHVATPDDLRDVMPSRASRTAPTMGSTPSAIRRRPTTALRFTRDGGTTVIVGLPAAGPPARPRPVRADPQGEAPHRDALRLRGPRGLAPGDARACPRGPTRPLLVPRPVVLARRRQRRCRGEPRRRGGRVLVVPERALSRSCPRRSRPTAPWTTSSWSQESQW